MENNNIIHLILSKVVLSNIISSFVSLQKKGSSSFLALCPFHEEKTPSFTVNDEKGLYHCFGCKASGNAITFLTKMEHISAKQALEKLSTITGVPLTEASTKKYQQEVKIGQTLYAINTFAEQQWKKELLSTTNEGMEYLKKRQITLKTIEQFGLGYAPQNTFFLTQKIPLLGDIKEKDLLQSSLFYQNKFAPPALKDRFTHRLIFPIKNTQGKTVAFGSRVLDDSLPKYINTNETPIFQKKQTLYGLSFAKESIVKDKRVFIVEGYFDVLAMHQFGFSNTVATLGTSLTIDHLKQLQSMVKNFTFMFDGDTAGYKACEKAILLSLTLGVAPFIVLFNDGVDPHDYLTRYGKEKLEEFLKTNTHSWVEFYLLSMKDKDALERKKKIQEILGHLKPLDPFLIEEFLQNLSQTFDIPLETLKRYYLIKEEQSFSSPSFLDGTGKWDGARRINGVQKTPLSLSSSRVKNNAEWNILALLCENPQIYIKYQDSFSLSFFVDTNAREIFKQLSLFWETVLNPSDFSLSIFQKSLSPHLRPYLEKWLLSADHTLYNPEKQFIDSLYLIQILNHQKDIKDIQQSIKEQEEKQNHEEVTKLLHILKVKYKAIAKLKELRAHTD
jgi:DNA primase